MTRDDGSSARVVLKEYKRKQGRDWRSFYDDELAICDRLKGRCSGVAPFIGEALASRSDWSRGVIDRRSGPVRKIHAIQSIHTQRTRTVKYSPMPVTLLELLNYCA